MRHMTSRERTLCVLSGGVPDRVPLDFSANADTLARLQRDLKVASHHALLDRLHIDIVDLRGIVDPIYRGPVPQQKTLPGGIVENLWGWRTKRMTTAMGIEDSYCDFVLSDCQNVMELKAHCWPQPDWFDFEDYGDRLCEWEGRALMASGASVWQHASFLRGVEQMCMDFAVFPELAEFIMDKFTSFYETFFDRMFTAAPGKIDILRIADDVGTQHSLLFSPTHFDNLFAPRLKRLINMAHSHNVKIMFHSCGAIFPLIERLIELGVDILDPIQVSADGMDPGLIKERFGSRTCLHGAIDTQYLLPRGNVTDIANMAQKMIEILGKDGGYILAPSHVLQCDVPTDNVLSLYEKAYSSWPAPQNLSHVL